MIFEVWVSAQKMAGGGSGGCVRGRGACVAGGLCMVGGPCVAGGHAWWGACMAGGCAWQWGVHGRGVHRSEGHAWGGGEWWGACVAGGMHGRGPAWQGVCVWWGMCDRGECAWQGACMVAGVWQGACVAGGGGSMSGGRRQEAGETATAANGTHPTGMHFCFSNFSPKTA